MPRAILPEPPEELKRLSIELSGKIREEIESQGFMPFSRYMEMALYHPGLGYYSAGLHKLGAAGDFTTAPELGSLFAHCLAKQVGQVAAELVDYDILEVGAGSGRMAADVLGALAPELLPRRYRILERSADLRAVQAQTIATLQDGLKERVEWLDRPPPRAWRGVLLANEVADALAVERFRIGAGGGVEQAGVGLQGERFAWRYRAAPAELASAVQRLGLRFEAGYTSEINLQLAPWLAALHQRLEQGLALLIDYGYPRSEYYLPQRSDGTLICHYRHRAHDDVFFWPGLQDLTAFVDFTALAEAGRDCGLELAGYANLAMFLLGCGLDRILMARSAGGAMDPELSAEARQLTLPGMMGERFQVMALTRGMALPLQGFAVQDLSYRL